MPSRAIIYGAQQDDARIVSPLRDIYDFSFEADPFQGSPIRDAEVIVLFSDSILRETQIRPSLRAVICRSTGTDNILCKTALRERGIRLFHGKGYATQAVAEFTIACMFDAYFKSYFSIPLAGRREMASLNTIIFGSGAIGTRVRLILESIGCRPKVVTREMNKVEIKKALQEADVVTLNTNLREDNIKMCDDDFFLALKEGAVFVNAARGGLVNNASLLWALTEGKVAHAYLDVIDRDLYFDALNAHARVTRTLHTAWKTPSSLARSEDFLVRTLKRLGSELLH